MEGLTGGADRKPGSARDLSAPSPRRHLIGAAPAFRNGRAGTAGAAFRHATNPKASLAQIASRRYMARFPGMDARVASRMRVRGVCPHFEARFGQRTCDGALRARLHRAPGSV